MIPFCNFLHCCCFAAIDANFFPKCCLSCLWHISTFSLKDNFEGFSQHQDTNIQLDKNVHEGTNVHKDTNVHEDTNVQKDFNFHEDTNVQEDNQLDSDFRYPPRKKEKQMFTRTQMSKRTQMSRRTQMSMRTQMSRRTQISRRTQMSKRTLSLMVIFGIHQTKKVKQKLLEV